MQIQNNLISGALEADIELELTVTGIAEKAVVKACNNPKYQTPIGKEALSADLKYFRHKAVDLLIGVLHGFSTVINTGRYMRVNVHIRR